MKTCKEDGCNGKCHSKGLCNKHYLQLWHHGKIFKRTKYDPNEIIIKGDIAEIVLYNNKCKEVARTTIDSEDVDKIKGYKWGLSDKGYVRTRLKKGMLQIQHIVLGVKPNRERQIDHRNRNPLINQKTNLRLCTAIGNNRNKSKPKNNKSGYKGVYWNKESKKWRAIIRVNKKAIHLGLFKDKTKAAVVYNEAAIKFHKEFACLNKL